MATYIMLSSLTDEGRKTRELAEIVARARSPSPAGSSVRRTPRSEA